MDFQLTHEMIDKYLPSIDSYYRGNYEIIIWSNGFSDSKISKLMYVFHIISPASSYYTLVTKKQGLPGNQYKGIFLSESLDEVIEFYNKLENKYND